jgi:uridine kinase
VEKVDHSIDWRRQRPVLETLAQGHGAEWHPYDWEANDGSRAPHTVTCGPAPVIILDGVYSARPKLVWQSWGQGIYPLDQAAQDPSKTLTGSPPATP